MAGSALVGPPCFAAPVTFGGPEKGSGGGHRLQRFATFAAVCNALPGGPELTLTSHESDRLEVPTCELPFCCYPLGLA
eukprot:9666817-Alexandrium_andersonii.AAC.1